MAATKQPIGITFPIQLGPSGYFNQSFDVLEQVASNLSSLLSTRPGERRMVPDFGSSLFKYVFEQDTDNIQDILSSVVKRDVDKWMPYISVESVYIENDSVQRDNNTVKLIVTYTADTIGITKEQTVEISLTNSNT